MSVTSVNEARLKRKGNDTPKDGYKFSRAFLVTTNDINDGPEDIMENAALPKIGDQYPGMSYMRAVNRDCETYEDDFHWYVLIDYMINNSLEVVRTNDRPKISFFSAAHEKVAEKAYQDGDEEGKPTKPIENSAKDPFDPPVITDKRNLVISITRNESLGQFNANTIASIENTLNSSAMTIAGVSIAVHEGYMRTIKADSQYDNTGWPFYVVTYEIEVDRETHVQKVLDRGFYELSGGYPVPIKDAEGNKKDEPTKLDGNGVALINEEEPVYLSYRIKPEASWSALGLPVAD